MASDDDNYTTDRHWKRYATNPNYGRCPGILTVDNLNDPWQKNFSRLFGECRRVYVCPEEVSPSTALEMLSGYAGDRFFLALFVQPLIIVRSDP